MNYSEQCIVMNCRNEHLVGIVSRPTADVTIPSARARIGLIIIVGGPQYRVGSHRQFVLLARAVAAAGTPVLRFDYRGMGDSTGGLHTFDNADADIAIAIDALKTAEPEVRYVALWGLCDGASAALLYCHATQDARVNGLCLLNPWVRSEVSLARTQVRHYYTQRMRQKEFWTKLLSGKVAVGAARALVSNFRKAFWRTDLSTVGTEMTFQNKMAQAFRSFQGKILLVLSGKDYTAKEFLEHAGASPAWEGALDGPHIQKIDVSKADHTFSSADDRVKVETQTIQWLASLLIKTNER